MSSLVVDGDDLFWSVQLQNNAPSTLPAPEGSADYKDHALPAGAAVTEHSLASVLGRVCEVSVPRVHRAQDGDRSDAGSGEGRSDISSSSSVASEESVRQTTSSLTLKLRHVNGDGVMSGVGGDVWCAALLLSAYLLETPEVVRGLDVLELGSGLGLCGIVAGYLAQSVTLTDYVDELIVNLHHNVELNRTPRVVGSNQLPNESVEPPSESPQQQQRRLGRGKTSRSALRPLSRVRVRKLDWTTYDRCARRGGPDEGHGDDRGCEEDETNVEDVEGWWWEDRGPHADRPREGVEGRTTGGGRGERPATTAPEEAREALRCDVVIGSALVYSPHHACVADVLSRAFVDGGCRAAHVVQLSTRPGFDEFLCRLGSCGLRYRLHRISSVLSPEVLEEVRVRASAAVVGGPVKSQDADAQTKYAGGNDDGSIGGEGEGGPTADPGTPVAGDVEADAARLGAVFDEFVLCCVFRASAEQEGSAS